MDRFKSQVFIGIISDSLGEYDQAEAYYRKVLEIAPNHPDANNNLAFILSEKPNHLEEAFRLAKVARENVPKIPMSRIP